MADPRGLLVGLLDYIKEQAKEVNPRGYSLVSAKSFVRQRNEIAGLPGVEFDIRVEGDHLWLRVPRLAAEPPPIPAQAYKSFMRVSSDPAGPAPSIDDAAYNRYLMGMTAELKSGGKSSAEEISKLESDLSDAVALALRSYSTLWESWAAGERPRRDTIRLYSDLFSLMHQLEAEQTSNPQELIWGIGVATWQLESGLEQIAFEFPLLSQTLEIGVDNKTMAIELRPRSTDTRVEMDAFIACQVVGAVDVERAAHDHLAKHKDSPVTPFDAGSYSDILKLIAANLDSEGSYIEVLAHDCGVPRPSKDLVVTDAWVLISRPRAINFLFDDLSRLREKLEDGCLIHEGPLALVTRASDEPIVFDPISFRGLSGRGRSNGDGGRAEELYFPLPYNDEQVAIIQHLERASGVAVQAALPGQGRRIQSQT